MRDFWHKLTNYEYWPTWLFYLPVYLCWPVFSWRAGSVFFFTMVNPGIKGGGSFGESKADILQKLPSETIPQTRFIKSQALLPTDLDFPVVAKPDVGERGTQVKIIHDQIELSAYQCELGQSFIIQDYLNGDFEAGVFVYRDPKQNKIIVSSITQKEFLTIQGDGKKTIGQLVDQTPRSRFQWKRIKDKFDENKILELGEVLILEKIGNHCKGTKFIDRNDLKTIELEKYFENLFQKLPDLFYGRFDLKADSIEKFKRAETIKFMEFNGAFSEPGHIYDPKHSLISAWSDLLSHWWVMAKIAGNNKKNGINPLTPKELWIQFGDYRRTLQS